MMKTLKYILLLTTIICLSIIVKAQNSGGFLITQEGEKIDFFGNKSYITAQYVYYNDSNDKERKIKQSDVKIYFAENRLFITLEMNSTMNRLQEVIAFNDKYILTWYYSSGFMYVWDREYKKLEDRILFVNMNKAQIEKNKERLNQQVVKYFKDCPQLLEALMSNIEKNIEITKGIYYYNCNNAPDLISNKVQDKKEEVKENVKTNKKQSYGISKKNGEKIIFYHREDLPITNKGNFGYYPNEKNDLMKYSWYSKFKLIVSAERLYYELEVTPGETKLLEIIAFNNNYVLAGSWGNDDVTKCYIYDREYHLIEGDIQIKKKDYTILKTLDKYFKECIDLRVLVENNIKFLRNISQGFTYYNCGNSTDLMKW